MSYGVPKFKHIQSVLFSPDDNPFDDETKTIFPGTSFAFPSTGKFEITIAAYLLGTFGIITPQNAFFVVNVGGSEVRRYFTYVPIGTKQAMGFTTESIVVDATIGDEVEVTVFIDNSSENTFVNGDSTVRLTVNKFEE
jgi:hypothetical protein